MRLQPLVEQFLSERGLALSPAKTVITHVDDGFDFLGQTVRRLNGKLLIKPAKRSICSVLTKIRGIIRGSHGVFCCGAGGENQSRCSGLDQFTTATWHAAGSSHPWTMRFG
jgi:hypothetical protein